MVRGCRNVRFNNIMRIKIFIGILAIVLIFSGAFWGRPVYADTLPVTAGLILWFDASQITGKSDGDAVTSWSDVSGNGYSATTNGFFSGPTYETNELNGHPVVRFVAASNQALRAFYTQPVGGYEPWTMFVVGRLSGGANGRLMGAIYPDNQNWLLGWWNGYEKVAYYNGFISDGGTGIAPTTNYRIFTGKGDGTYGYFYDSESLWVPRSTAGYANPNGGIAFSGYAAASTEEMSNGDIAEMIYYQGALSDVDRVAVYNYLYNKYFVAPPTVFPARRILSGKRTVISGKSVTM